MGVVAAAGCPLSLTPFRMDLVGNSFHIVLFMASDCPMRLLPKWNSSAFFLIFQASVSLVLRDSEIFFKANQTILYGDQRAAQHNDQQMEMPDGHLAQHPSR